MCELARHNCEPFPQVEIYHSLFEDWELTPGKFDAVVAATSFHWVSVDIAYPKTAAALKDNGVLILLWNVVPHPPQEIFQLLQPIYQTHAPSLATYQDLATEIEPLLHGFEPQIIDSGYFQGLMCEQWEYEITYSIDDYLLLLTTLSPYIRIEAEQREKLFIGLRAVLEQNLPNGVPLTHVAIVQVARKI
jgi:SAM-dependent methyltransferase